MEDVEIYNKLQLYKVFKVHYLNNKVTILLNYDELLTELNKQQKFWARKDRRHNFEDGFSYELEKLITKFGEVFSNIDVNVLSSNYTLANYFYNNINFRNDFISFSISNGEVLINLNLFTHDESFMSSFSEAYVYCLFNNEKDTLKEVISLYSNNTRINNYTSEYRNTPKYKALILYLSLETKNVKRVNIPSKLTEDIDNINSDIQLIQDDVSKSKEDLSNFNIQYRQELKTWVEEKNLWFKEKEDEIEEIKQRYLTRIDELENLYAEKLKLEEPSQYWSEKANEYKSSFHRYLGGTVVISIALLIISSCLVQKLYESVTEMEKINSFLPISFVTVAIISFLVYILRTCIKLMMSSKHLETEYKQKSMFTYFYLSLLSDKQTSKEITATEKSLIYNNLFANPDTGLIKAGQDNSELSSLLSLLAKR